MAGENSNEKNNIKSNTPISVVCPSLFLDLGSSVYYGGDLENKNKQSRCDCCSIGKHCNHSIGNFTCAEILLDMLAYDCIGHIHCVTR